MLAIKIFFVKKALFLKIPSYLDETLENMILDNYFQNIAIVIMVVIMICGKLNLILCTSSYNSNDYLLAAYLIEKSNPD